MAMPHKGAAALIMRCRLMLAVRLLWECRGGIRDGSGAKRRKALQRLRLQDFPRLPKAAQKRLLTTGMTTDRKKLYFYRSPWYHGRKVNIRVWLNW